MCTKLCFIKLIFKQFQVICSHNSSQVICLQNYSAQRIYIILFCNRFFRLHFFKPRLTCTFLWHDPEMPIPNQCTSLFFHIYLFFTILFLSFHILFTFSLFPKEHKVADLYDNSDVKIYVTQKDLEALFKR